MRVRQYVYFGISSPTVTPDAITTAVGLAPDATRLMGSRSPGPPPLPRFHLWDVPSGLPHTVALDQHLASLISKLSGHEGRIRSFLENEDAAGGITVVRHFEPGPDDDAVVEPGRAVDGLERVRGQHPLLGFHLEPEQLAVAVRLGCGIDFDEYGDEYE